MGRRIEEVVARFIEANDNILYSSIWLSTVTMGNGNFNCKNKTPTERLPYA